MCYMQCIFFIHYICIIYIICMYIICIYVGLLYSVFLVFSPRSPPLSPSCLAKPRPSGAAAVGREEEGGAGGGGGALEGEPASADCCLSLLSSAPRSSSVAEYRGGEVWSSHYFCGESASLFFFL